MMQIMIPKQNMKSLRGKNKQTNKQINKQTNKQTDRVACSNPAADLGRRPPNHLVRDEQNQG